MSAADLREGPVAPALAAEHERLGLVWLAVPVHPGRSPRPLRRRLRDLSSRMRGPQALLMRQQTVPQAYRVFFRHIGLDPDRDRPPGEAAVVDRLLVGEFRSRNLVDDALLLALLETGVPVWALDAAAVSGAPGLRLSGEGERIGRGEDTMPVVAGRIVVADDAGPLALLFEPPGPGTGVRRSTERAILFAVRVAGVPAIHIEEALWTCAELLGGSWEGP
jgi:DNA/RNA-binding domain of Phe-tRNA-synthetase-like protein